MAGGGKKSAAKPLRGVCVMLGCHARVTDSRARHQARTVLALRSKFDLDPNFVFEYEKYHLAVFAMRKANFYSKFAVASMKATVENVIEMHDALQSISSHDARLQAAAKHEAANRRGLTPFVESLERDVSELFECKEWDFVDGMVKESEISAREAKMSSLVRARKKLEKLAAGTPAEPAIAKQRKAVELAEAAYDSLNADIVQRLRDANSKFAPHFERVLRTLHDMQSTIHKSCLEHIDAKNFAEILPSEIASPAQAVEDGDVAEEPLPVAGEDAGGPLPVAPGPAAPQPAVPSDVEMQPAPQSAERRDPQLDAQEVAGEGEDSDAKPVDAPVQSTSPAAVPESELAGIGSVLPPRASALASPAKTWSPSELSRAADSPSGGAGAHELSAEEMEKMRSLFADESVLKRMEELSQSFTSKADPHANRRGRRTVAPVVAESKDKDTERAANIELSKSELVFNKSDEDVVPLNKPVSVTFEVKNLSTIPARWSIIPPNRMNFSLHFSPSHGVIKKQGKSQKVKATITIASPPNLFFTVACHVAGTSEATFFTVRARCESGVFGVHLDSLPFEVDRGLLVPEVLATLRRAIYKDNGLMTEGIFRLAGDALEMQRVKKELNAHIFLSTRDVNCLANLIKIWFREMPVHIMDQVEPQLLETMNGEADVMAAKETLPKGERACLDWLVELLCDVQDFSEVNLMNFKNLAIVVAPNLYQARSLRPGDIIRSTQKSVNFLYLCLVHRRKERLAACEEDGDILAMRDQADEAQERKKRETIRAQKFAETVAQKREEFEAEETAREKAVREETARQEAAAAQQKRYGSSLDVAVPPHDTSAMSPKSPRSPRPGRSPRSSVVLVAPEEHIDESSSGGGGGEAVGAAAVVDDELSVASAHTPLDIPVMEAVRDAEGMPPSSPLPAIPLVRMQTPPPEPLPASPYVDDEEPPQNFGAAASGAMLDVGDGDGERAEGGDALPQDALAAAGEDERLPIAQPAVGCGAAGAGSGGDVDVPGIAGFAVGGTEAPLAEVVQMAEAEAEAAVQGEVVQEAAVQGVVLEAAAQEAPGADDAAAVGGDSAFAGQQDSHSAGEDAGYDADQQQMVYYMGEDGQYYAYEASAEDLEGAEVVYVDESYGQGGEEPPSEAPREPESVGE